MIRWFQALVLVLMSALVAGQAWAAGDPGDAANCKDPALFTRMPGYHIYLCEQREFDSYKFASARGKEQAVEGKWTSAIYYPNEGVKRPSPLQIIRNYANAATAAGGSLVYQYEDGGVQFATLRIAGKGAEAWACIEASGNGTYVVRIVEKEAMNQAVVADAASLAGSIKDSGKVAVYGIHFDTNKSVVKPASEPALAEIAKLLQKDPKLKVFLVGHTDNQGSFEPNLALSKARAAAVIEALVKKGIQPARMTPFGAASTSPVASNASEEGRARNRRVELVAQ